MAHILQPDIPPKELGHDIKEGGSFDRIKMIVPFGLYVNQERIKIQGILDLSWGRVFRDLAKIDY